MELLVKAGTRHYADQDKAQSDWRDGQILEIKPDGFGWGGMDLQHNLVVRLPGDVPTHLFPNKSRTEPGLLYPQYDAGRNMVRRRNHYIDLKTLLTGPTGTPTIQDVYDKSKPLSVVDLTSSLAFDTLVKDVRDTGKFPDLHEYDRGSSISSGSATIGTSQDYATVNAFEADIVNLTGQLTGTCNTNDSDTTATTFAGFTTTSTYYLLLDTASANRHLGVWNTGKYRYMPSVEWGFAMNINVSFMRLQWMQIENTGTRNNAAAAIGIDTGGTDDVWVTESILWVSGGGTPYEECWGIYRATDPSGNVTKVRNCVLYNWYAGIYIDYSGSGGNGYIYNNTIADCTNTGIFSYLSSPTVLKVYNNISNNEDAGGIDYYFESGPTADDDNISGDSTSPNPPHRDDDLTFLDRPNDNYHLHSTDTAAMDAGTDLSGDGDLPVTIDIDGDPRHATAPDIGADEYVAEGVAYIPKAIMVM